MPVCPGHIRVSQAGDDVPDAVGKGANSAEANARFLVSRVVGVGKGEASEMLDLVELVQDASRSAVSGDGEIDAVGR